MKGPEGFQWAPPRNHINEGRATKALRTQARVDVSGSLEKERPQFGTQFLEKQTVLTGQRHLLDCPLGSLFLRDGSGSDGTFCSYARHPPDEVSKEILVRYIPSHSSEIRGL